MYEEQVYILPRLYRHNLLDCLIILFDYRVYFVLRFSPSLPGEERCVYMIGHTLHNQAGK